MDDEQLIMEETTETVEVTEAPSPVSAFDIPFTEYGLTDTLLLLVLLALLASMFIHYFRRG